MNRCMRPGRLSWGPAAPLPGIIVPLGARPLAAAAGIGMTVACRFLVGTGGPAAPTAGSLEAEAAPP